MAAEILTTKIRHDNLAVYIFCRCSGKCNDDWPSGNEIVEEGGGISLVLRKISEISTSEYLVIILEGIGSLQ